MKISITSSDKLEKFYVKDLCDKIYCIDLDTPQDIPAGWYELNIFYVDRKIEIEDILINDASLREFIYTGYYVDGNGDIHQPGCALWDKGGCFKIWIHTEVGVMFQRILETIRNDDYGTNLFEKYMLTVERPIKIKESWGEPYISFFANGDGPRWWLNNDRFTPWKIADIPNVDKDMFLRELDQCLPFFEKLADGWTRKSLARPPRELPFIPWKEISSSILKDFFQKIGYKRIMDISLQTLSPNTAIEIHKDEHYNFIKKGCKTFYWNITPHENVYFKLGKSGLLPLQYPLFINTIEHPHAVVNERTTQRTVIIAYGEM
jgi:hypothetical protein